MALVQLASRENQPQAWTALASDTLPDLSSHPDLKPGALVWITDQNLVKEWSGSAWQQKSTNGAWSVVDQAIKNIRNPESTTEAWGDVRSEVIQRLISSTSATTIGGGSADDTLLMGLIILQNATAVTAGIAGMQDDTGAAATVTFTGSTSQDVFLPFGGLGIRNDKGALTITASVANKVIVLYRAR